VEHYSILQSKIYCGLILYLSIGVIRQINPKSLPLFISIFNNKKPSEKVINEWCQRYAEFLVGTSFENWGLMGSVEPPELFFRLTVDGISLVNKY